MRCGKLCRIFSLMFLTFMLGAIVGAQNNSSSANPGKIQRNVRNDTDEAKTSLRAIVVAGKLENLWRPNFSNYRVQVENLYRHSNFKPIWIRGGLPTVQAKQMIAILQQADNVGLRSEDYDASLWPPRLARLQGPHSQSDEARFDVALTVSTMRYVSDIRIGRIDPRYFRFSLDVGPKQINLAAFIQKNLVNGSDLQSAIARLEPPLPGYWRLRAALPKYIELAKADDGEQLPNPPGMGFSGTQYEGIPRLARLLRLLGDLPADAEISPDSKIYEEPLVEAVKRFQERHGLRPDGYLDVNTIYELNVPLSDRVEQIRLSLERYRWLRYDFPQPPVIVNIPEFRLYALNRENEVSLTMPVDVGQEYTDTRTPILESNIEYLVFRPYWDVPYDIEKDEIIPNVKEDPDYLSEVHFEVVDPHGKIVTDGKVTSQILEAIRRGQFRVRQKPGSDNSLGLVKFAFPNRYDVYLHDTPSWGQYFSNPDRNISHGCIHVKEPAQLAAWMLRDKPEWTLEKVQHAMNDGPDNFRVNLTKPLPVLIVYLTAVAHEDGKIYLYSDIYGYDAELKQALAKGYPYP